MSKRPNGIVALESDAMLNIAQAFLARRFCVLPRGGWTDPVPVLKHYNGIVWRENVGVFRVGKRLIKAGGFAGRPDWGGVTKTGQMICFEAKKDEETGLSPMQKHMGEWLRTYNAMWAKVWDFQSTIDALKSYGY